MLTALSALASEQNGATERTKQKLHQFLDYCATHPNATVRYFASDMTLKIHSDASYLSEPKGRSRAGGFFYLGNNPPKDEVPNGPILVKSEIQRQVLSSAAESEIAAAFSNAKDATQIRTTLNEMGHPQPATPIQLDNTTAVGFANQQIKQRKSKAIDMRFYWLQDRVNQKQFHVYWAPGSKNLADYFTKHHPTVHHRHIRYFYLYSTFKSPTYRTHPASATLRGCADLESHKVDSRSGLRVPLSNLPTHPTPSCARHDIRIPLVSSHTSLTCAPMTRRPSRRLTSFHSRFADPKH